MPGDGGWIKKRAFSEVTILDEGVKGFLREKKRNYLGQDGRFFNVPSNNNNLITYPSHTLKERAGDGPIGDL